MKKKLFRMFVFGVLLFMASKAFIAFTAYQLVSGIKEHYKSDLLLTYGWISSTLGGQVSIEGLEITPYKMKKTFNLDEITFQFTDYFSLVTNLPSLRKGGLDGLKSVTIPKIQTELNGKSFKQMIAQNFGQLWVSPFSVYGCGATNLLSPEDFEYMGISQWISELSIEIGQTTQGNDLLSIILDEHELGRLKVVSEWSERSIESLLNKQGIENLTLFDLTLEHQDAGFFRRLNILCNNEGLKRSTFSANAAMAWRNAMYSQGLLVSNNLVELYATYFMQGGSLLVEANMDDGFPLSNFMGLLNKDVIKYFNVAISLNSQKIIDPELYVDGSILFPPVEKEHIDVLPVQQEVSFQPSYKAFEIEVANQHLGRKIRVKMLDGKEYEGKLSSVTEYNLELTQNLAGGVVDYPLMLNEIDTFEAWINQQQ